MDKYIVKPAHEIHYSFIYTCKHDRGSLERVIVQITSTDNVHFHGGIITMVYKVSTNKLLYETVKIKEIFSRIKVDYHGSLNLMS